MFTRQVSEASFQIMESFKGALAKSIEDGTQAATLSMLPTDALRTEAQKWMDVSWLPFLYPCVLAPSRPTLRLGGVDF